MLVALQANARRNFEGKTQAGCHIRDLELGIVVHRLVRPEDVGLSAALKPAKHVKLRRVKDGQPLQESLGQVQILDVLRLRRVVLLPILIGIDGGLRGVQHLEEALDLHQRETIVANTLPLRSEEHTSELQSPMYLV